MRARAVPSGLTFGNLWWWLPRLAFLMFIAALIALFWFIERTEREEQRATLISDMLWLEQNLRFLLNHNEDLLGRVDPRRVDQPGMFDAHAQTLIASSTGIAQVVWFGLARTLPPTASAFSIMAVPLVGTASAIAIVGEVPGWQDWAAALFVVLAIASALLGRPATK